MKNKTSVKTAFELLAVSFHMSPANTRMVVLSKAADALRTIAMMLLPAVLLNLLQAKSPFSVLITAIIIYAVILYIADSGVLGFGLLETAFGYTANNMASLRVGQKAMRMEYARFEDADTLGRYSRAQQATWIFSDAVECTIGNLIPALMVLVPSIYIVSQIHIIALILIAAFIGLELLADNAKKKKLYGISLKRTEHERRYNYTQKILHDLSFGKELRMYDMLDFILGKNRESERILLEIDRESKSAEILYTVVSLVLSAIQLSIAYLFAVMQYDNGSVQIAFFVALVASIRMLFMGIRSLSGILVDVRELVCYYGEYKAFMDTCEAPMQKSAYPVGADDSISFCDVSFQYPHAKEYALKNVTFSIPSGSSLSLVGENGSGKTTLVKLLCRLYEPTQGRILLGGRDIKEYDLWEYMRVIAPVFQDFRLHAYSIRENIAFQEKDDELIWKILFFQGLGETISGSPYGLDTYVTKTLSENGRDFSGGEKQKLALTRALFKMMREAPRHNRIILLDEPTSAIDPLAEAEYYSNIKRIVANTTTLFITHRMASVKTADHIAVLEKGRLVEYGSFDELLRTNGAFFELFKVQADLYEKK